MPPPDHLRCTGTTRSGDRCRAYRSDGEHCRMHQPADQVTPAAEIPGRITPADLVVADYAGPDDGQPCPLCLEDDQLPLHDVAAYIDGIWHAPVCAACLADIDPHGADQLRRWAQLTGHLDTEDRQDLIWWLTNLHHHRAWFRGGHLGTCSTGCRHPDHEVTR